MTNLTLARVGMALMSVVGFVACAAVARAQQVSSVQPGQDASQRADEARGVPIAGQYQSAEPMPPRFALPDPRYAPTPADVYRPGYIYGPRRMYRQAVRFGYPAVAVAVPRVPTDFFGYPMYGPVRSPLGVDKSWNGPSGYNYSSAHAQALEAQGQFLPPRPGMPATAMPPYPGPSNLAMPPEPAPEPIPAPAQRARSARVLTGGAKCCGGPSTPADDMIQSIAVNVAQGSVRQK